LFVDISIFSNPKNWIVSKIEENNEVTRVELKPLMYLLTVNVYLKNVTKS